MSYAAADEALCLDIFALNSMLTDAILTGMSTTSYFM